MFDRTPDTPLELFWGIQGEIIFPNWRIVMESYPCQLKIRQPPFEKFKIKHIIYGYWLGSTQNSKFM